jgi:glycosyl transferase family 25
MRAVYINLDRAPGRRRSMEAQSDRFGLRLERIAAVDGREIDEAERQRLSPATAEAPLSRSELGCYRSHMLAWRAIVDAGEPWGLVFEDDVFLADDIAAFAADADWIPADAAVVRLSSNRLPVTLSVAPVGRHSGRELVRLRSATVDLGGYVIAAAHARMLLDRTRHYERPVDRLLLDPADGSVIYQLYPGAVVQAKWADFAFLPQADAASQIQNEKPPRRRRPLGAKLRGELRNLYARVIFPATLPLTQRFRPASRRLRVAPVPFRA